MARDWHEEFEALLRRERKAFKKHRNTQFALADHLRLGGKLPDGLIADSETARVEWEETNAAIAIFLLEYGQSL